MIDIRLPNITATDPAAQMSEVRSYLYQMVEQLNWALNTLDTGSVTANGSTAVISNSNGNAGDGGGTMSSEVLENFGSLKSLIIKTAEAANSEIGRLDDAIANLKLSNKAIESVSESYYKSTSPTELKGGSWVDKYPGWEQGTYIWTRSTITYSDGSKPTVTEPMCVTGSTGNTGSAGYTPIKGVDYFDGVAGKDGTPGSPGRDGKNGLSVFITYNDSATDPEKPTGDGTLGGWHTDATSAAIWISQKVAATATSGDWGEPIKIKGDKGDRGEIGKTGATGNGIAGVDVEYRLSDSDTELTGDYEWQTSIDTIPEECSLWTRNKITYTNGDVAYTAECCISRYNIDTVIKTIRDAVTEGTQGVYADMESQRAEFDGIYYAKSDFGDFLENYKQILSIDPTAINQAYSDIQTLCAEKEEIKEAIISTNANIKTGILYYDDDGVPIYGVEVGQTTEVNGKELFNKFARFTSSRLSFYDANGSEVAYISDYKLYITNAQILGNLYLGGYILDTTNGIAFIWNG